MLLRSYKGDELSQGVFNLNPMSPEQLVVSRMLFAKQQKKGIHRNSFEDNVWTITSRGTRKKIHFENVKYHPQGMTHAEYIQFLKLYVCKCIDKKAVSSVASGINAIIAITNQTYGFTRRNPTAISEPKERIIKDFLTELGLQNFTLHVLDVRNGNKGDNRRKLSTDFWTYFVMDYEIKQFWKEATTEEKLVYGPLYLFWIIGNILPMRPFEFCLIERDCIRCVSGKYYISIPKSGIKGKPWAITNDKNTQDKTYSFQIVEEVAKDIMWYRDMVRDDVPSDLFIKDCLFNNMAFNRIAKKGLPRTEEFSRSHLDKLKKGFLKELEKKGYKKVKDVDMECTDHYQKWVSDWNLNDLRHLALINMIQRGIDPTIIMIYAGHDDIEQACHYYSNVSEMSGVRLNFEKKYDSDYKLPATGFNMRALKNTTSPKPVVGGQCLYDGPENLKIQNCAKYYGCEEDGCPYFKPKDKGKEKRILQSREERIDKLMKYFVDSIFHEEKECAEEALFKLQREIKIYERSRTLYEPFT